MSSYNKTWVQVFIQYQIWLEFLFHYSTILHDRFRKLKIKFLISNKSHLLFPEKLDQSIKLLLISSHKLQRYFYYHFQQKTTILSLARILIRQQQWYGSHLTFSRLFWIKYPKYRWLVFYPLEI